MQPPYEATMGINSSDPSFDLTANADFLVWDRELGFELLGSNPQNEFMFEIAEAVHDAPVESPMLGRKLANPVLYSANGATYHNGLIYYCVGGGNSSIDVGSGFVSRPGIYTLNATSAKSNALLNNYFGWYFNTCDDITVDSKGDIWFTDPSLSWGNKVDTLAPATYRFPPSTGLVSIIEDTLLQPDGIAISPSGRTPYISDTGAISAPTLQSLGMLGYYDYNITSPHTIFAYDVVDGAGGAGAYLVNKRPVYLGKNWIPDGVKVSREGYVVTGTGNAVDVLTPEGAVVLSIKTNYTAVNVNWAGGEFEDLWVVGIGGVSRVRGLNIHGPRVG